MRTTAGNIKKNSRGSVQEKPREGSKLRILYDRAMTGDWFIVSDIYLTNKYNMINQLRLFYELEIIDQRRFRKPSLYKCIGRWDGTTLRSIEDVKEALVHTQGQSS